MRADRKALLTCSAILYPFLDFTGGLILRLIGNSPLLWHLMLKMWWLLQCALLCSSSHALTLASGCYICTVHAGTNEARASPLSQS